MAEAQQRTWMHGWYDRFYAIRDLLDVDYCAAMAEMNWMRERWQPEKAPSVGVFR